MNTLIYAKDFVHFLPCTCQLSRAQGMLCNSACVTCFNTRQGMSVTAVSENACFLKEEMEGEDFQRLGFSNVQDLLWNWFIEIHFPACFSCFLLIFLVAIFRGLPGEWKSHGGHEIHRQDPCWTTATLFHQMQVSDKWFAVAVIWFSLRSCYKYSCSIECHFIQTSVWTCPSIKWAFRWKSYENGT